ncbi:hypothetical protein ACU8MG_25445 (plasmid) [Rhizobium leguminosarum]
MKQVGDTADQRNKSWCIHCSSPISSVVVNRDHAPSKILLDEPLPPNVPLMRVCQPCNSSFAEDEEYTAAFLGAVLSGSTDPETQVIERSARIFRGNGSLRARIAKSKMVELDLFEGEKVSWTAEIERIRRVVLKNARGHAYFELGEPMLDEPASVWFGPLASLNDPQLAMFEKVAWPDGLLPEVGSRLMTRLLTGEDLDEGWIVVQEGVYRYSVNQFGGLGVRIVMREYLGAEIIWN